jgi:hypothetical protein
MVQTRYGENLKHYTISLDSDLISHLFAQLKNKNCLKSDEEN